MPFAAVNTTIPTKKAEAFTTRNICTFFLAPDGRVFHYVSGYVSPGLFLRMLHKVRAARETAFDGHMKLRPGGPRGRCAR